jgi:TonB family protein
LIVLTGLLCASAQDTDRGAATTDLTPHAVLVELGDPIYPPLARQANVDGKVRVVVTVQPDGSSSAEVVSGHPMLKQAALESAMKSRFECQNCTAALQYSLVYVFELNYEGDCCTAFNAPVHVDQKPQTIDQGRAEMRIVLSTLHICLCDPSSDLIRFRSLKCLYLWKCALR